VLDEDTWSLLSDVKRAVDPDDTLNPSALGLGGAPR
jgi:FAD/FMN-containing dehydrogenase